MQASAAHGATVGPSLAVACCRLDTARGLGLLQGVLGEAQLGRQVGNVADGEAQGLDLG